MPPRERRLIRIVFDVRTGARINRFHEQVDAAAIEATSNSTAPASLSLFFQRERGASRRLLGSFRWDCRHVYWPSRDSQDCIERKKTDHRDTPEKRICSKTARYTIEKRRVICCAR